MAVATLFVAAHGAGGPGAAALAFPRAALLAAAPRGAGPATSCARRKRCRQSQQRSL